MKTRIIYKSINALLVLTSLLLACKKKTDDSCPICPVITSLTPNHGHHGDTVVISGSNFGENPTGTIIKFNGKSVDPTDILSGNSSEIKVRVPSKCGTGPVTIMLDADLYSDGGPTFTYEYIPVVSVFAGQPGVSGNPSSPVSLSSAQFNSPTQLQIDKSGILYVLDNGNQKVKKLDPVSNVFREVTGLFDAPMYISVDQNGNLYVATVYVGTGFTSGSFFKCPNGTYVCSNYRFIDVSNYGLTIMSLAVDGQMTTYAGIMGLFGDSGILLKVQSSTTSGSDTIIFGGPVITSSFINNNYLYQYCDFWTGMGTEYYILRMNLSNYVVDTVATPTNCSGIMGNSMAFSGSVLYVGDGNSGQIFYKSATGQMLPLVTTIFNSLSGMAVDRFGDVYVSERNNHCIKKISFE